MVTILLSVMTELWILHHITLIKHDNTEQVMFTNMF